MKVTLSLLLLSLLISLTVITALSFNQKASDNKLLRQIANRIMPAEPAANPPCVFGNYNFTSMNNSEWFGYDQNKEFFYYLRLCGTVQDSLCQADPLTKHSMLCQVQTNNSKMVYNIASADVQAMNWTYINPANTSAGVRLTMTNGDMCGPKNRTTYGLFTCGSTMGNFTVNTSAIDFGDCTYTLHIPSPLACVGEDNNMIEPPIQKSIQRRLPKKRGQAQMKGGV